MMIHEIWFDIQDKRVCQALLINQRGKVPGHCNGKPIGKGCMAC
jgi:hypothetical protein